MGDAHVVIINDDGEIVGRVTVGAQDDEIIKVLVGNDDAALGMIIDDRLTFLRGLEADDGFDALRCRCRVTVAPGAVIADSALFSLGLLAHGSEFFG